MKRVLRRWAIVSMGLSAALLCAACAGANDEDGVGTPDDFGQPCLVDGDCGGALACVLVDSSSGYICTLGCGNASCPDGATCVETSLGAWCDTEPLQDGFQEPDSPLDPDQPPQPDPRPDPLPGPEPEPNPDMGPDLNPDPNPGNTNPGPDPNDPCADAFEPNDTVEAAAELPEGFYEDLQICAAESDFFSMNLVPGDLLELQANFDTERGNLLMQILDSQGQSLQTALGGEGQIRMSRQIGQGGTYFVRVYGQGPTAENTYSLSMSISDAPDPGPDMNPDPGPGPDPNSPCTDALEPNDTWSSARNMNAPGFELGLRVCAGDPDDYYAINANAGDTIRADFLSFDLLSTVGMNIRGTNGSTILDSTLALLGLADLAVTVDTDGPHFIHVEHLIGDPATYSLEFYVDPGVVDPDPDPEPNPDPDCDDRFEPNNDTGTATPMMNGSLVDLDVCDADASDYYAVELGAGDTITATINFTDSVADLDLDLLAANGTTELDSSAGVSDSETVTHTATSATTVYIHVIHYEGDPNSYNLVVDIERGAPNGCLDDFELNNDAGSAAAITPGTYPDLSFCAGEDSDDFYAVDLTAGQTIEVVLTFDDDNGDIDMDLLAANGTTELDASAGVLDTETVTHTATADETVLIRAFGYLGQVTNTYSMTVTVD